MRTGVFLLAALATACELHSATSPANDGATRLGPAEAKSASPQVVADGKDDATAVWWIENREEGRIGWAHYAASTDSWSSSGSLARPGRAGILSLIDPYQTGHPVLVYRQTPEGTGASLDGGVTTDSWVAQFDPARREWSDWRKCATPDWSVLPVVVAPNGDVFTVTYGDDATWVQRRDVQLGQWHEPALMFRGKPADGVTLRADPSGSAMVLWSRRSAPAGWGLGAMHWDASVGAWGAPTPLGDGWSLASEALELDSRGNAFVAGPHHDAAEERMEIRALRYDAGSDSWGDPASLYELDPRAEGFATRLSVSGSGVATVRTDSVPAGDGAQLAVFDPDHVSWAVSRTSARGSAFEPAQVDAAGNVFVLQLTGSLFMNAGAFMVDRFDDSTRTWNDTGLFFDSAGPTLLVARDGRAMVSWGEVTGEGRSEHAAIYLPSTHRWTEPELPLADAPGVPTAYSGALARDPIFVWVQDDEQGPVIWAKRVELESGVK